MDLDVDSSTILYGVGAIFGTAAVLYFSREIIFDLSPTIKSALLLGAFGAFILAAMYTKSGRLERTFYVFSSVSYLGFLVYTILKFSFSTEQVFLTLGLSSALFIGLGYFIRERGAEMERETARKAILGLIVVGLALVAVDVIGPQAAYQTEFADEVNASRTGELTVGTVTIQNDFILSRDVDVPRYSACIYYPERRHVILSTRDAPDVVPGRSSATVDLAVRIPVRVVNETVDRSGPGLVPVEQMEECPESSEDRRIVVVEGEDFPY